MCKIDANKIIPKKKVIDFTKNVFGFEYLNTDVARTLVASIGADVLRKEKEAKGGAFDINEAIGSSIQSFAKLYDPNNSIYANKLESDKQLLSEINQSFTTFQSL
ncbi:MAG: hypothetical protein CM15mV51_1120 [uncultured marine virus]|nr:MAG: hypothetical protein CM15mV51_1120 [uncultured marine virus]